jgi:hypothetical protein
VIHIEILTAALPSKGRITCRLHLRHFNSTPSDTKRARRLPQPQRSDVPSFDAARGLAPLCGLKSVAIFY